MLVVVGKLSLTSQDPRDVHLLKMLSYKTVANNLIRRHLWLAVVLVVLTINGEFANAQDVSSIDYDQQCGKSPL